MVHFGRGAGKFTYTWNAGLPRARSTPVHFRTLAGVRSDDWTDLVRSDGPQFARGGEFAGNRA